MKKIFSLAIIVLILFSQFSFAEVYPKAFIVIDTIPETNTVTLWDSTGNVWEWYGVEDWMPGDIAVAIMDDNNTEIIFDDSILILQYSGMFVNQEAFVFPFIMFNLILFPGYFNLQTFNLHFPAIYVILYISNEREAQSYENRVSHDFFSSGPFR